MTGCAQPLTLVVTLGAMAALHEGGTTIRGELVHTSAQVHTHADDME